MCKKLLFSLVPLLATVAFTLLPAALAQAAPQYYKGNVKLKAGTELPYVSYGRLALYVEGGTGSGVECANVVVGTVENPSGEGPGVNTVEGWTAYDCKNGGCEEGGGKPHVVFENENGPGPAYQLDWTGHLVAVGSEIRLDTSNERMSSDCWFGSAGAPTEDAAPPPFEPLDTRGSTEMIAFLTPICTTEPPGLSEALEISATSFSKPAKTEFFGSAGPAKNELNCYPGRKGFTTGRLTNYGYTASNAAPSLIEVKAN